MCSRTLADYCARHRDFLDADDRHGSTARCSSTSPTSSCIERFRAAGLPFCYPRGVRALEGGRRRARPSTSRWRTSSSPRAARSSCNDFHLEEPERIFVVTGPNKGGKTTFARMFGQLHHLAGLGLPVPGSEAQLFLPDRIFTHFEKEEDIETLRGKLEDELVRVHEILEQATADSVIVMNESFSSTTLDDALFVGTEVHASGSSSWLPRRVRDVRRRDGVAQRGDGEHGQPRSCPRTRPSGPSRSSAGRPTGSPTPGRSPRSTASPTNA